VIKAVVLVVLALLALRLVAAAFRERRGHAGPSSDDARGPRT
jgi:hypothetical protein